MALLVYRMLSDGAADAHARRTSACPDNGLAVSLWRPTLADPFAPALNERVAAVWSALHALRVFSNRDYAQVVLSDGSRVVHRSGIYPRWMRFPFMARGDLQIGDTWTDPEYRGRALATCAIHHAVSLLRAPDRVFWYVAERNNIPSIRVAERAGFSLFGEAERTARFGSRALGAFVLRP